MLAPFCKETEEPPHGGNGAGREFFAASQQRIVYGFRHTLETSMGNIIVHVKASC